MKKTLLLLPIVAVLTACGTFSSKESYDKRADEQRKQQADAQQKVLDKTPDWYNKVPTSSNAVYESGFGSSFNMADADAYAKTDAYSKLCMAAGGKTSQQTKVFSTEGENSRTQVNERATKSFCPNVDLTGVEQREIKRIQAGNRIHTYVLVALPTGDANILRKAKEAQQEREIALRRAPEAFKELERN